MPYVSPITIEEYNDSFGKYFKINLPTIIFENYLNNSSISFSFILKDKANNYYTNSVSLKIVHSELNCLINKNIFSKEDSILYVKVKKYPKIKINIVIFNSDQQFICNIDKYYSCDFYYYVYKIDLKKYIREKGLYFVYINTSIFQKFFKIFVK